MVGYHIIDVFVTWFPRASPKCFLINLNQSINISIQIRVSLQHHFKLRIKKNSNPRYDLDEIEGIRYAEILCTAIRQKSSKDDIMDILKDIPNPLRTPSLNNVEPRCNPLQIDIFVQTLLYLGSETYSFDVISNYNGVLKVSFVHLKIYLIRIY